MTRTRITVAAGLWAMLASGCAASVPVVLDFPTAEAFRASELVRIDVVRLAPDALGTCPETLAASLRGDTLDLAFELEPTNVCTIRSGLALPDPGGGPMAFVAQVLDTRNTVILAGCTVAEAYPGARAVRIELYPTMGYTGSVALGDATMRAGASCAGGM